ncbi:MAG: type 1 glutamine amidotransferase domain-containing protein [Candidatus Woesearchaeota archaeon]|jgi:protease I|nr:type 1 glutamine amidotransferase domain-containing protein [Candidatus Woesearchaeota archaeon]|tara:strand:+ start:8404 stop:8910 length:507 start_codon:yes stop_codon:yes gene_type:complete
MAKKVLILVEQDFQDMEAMYPYYRLKEAGFDVKVAGSDAKSYKGKYGYPIETDGGIDDFDADDFDAVIVPGGWAPDYMRRNKAMVDFVKGMDEKGKVVAAICHAASLLVSANILKGKKMTCFIAVKDDAINAGADFVDKEVVVDGNLITSRKPDDLPAFCREIIKALG